MTVQKNCDECNEKGKKGGGSSRSSGNEQTIDCSPPIHSRALAACPSPPQRGDVEGESDSAREGIRQRRSGGSSFFSLRGDGGGEEPW